MPSANEVWRQVGVRLVRQGHKQNCCGTHLFGCSRTRSRNMPGVQLRYSKMLGIVETSGKHTSCCYYPDWIYNPKRIPQSFPKVKWRNNQNNWI